MPCAEAPLIDRRTYGDLVAEVEDLIQEYTGRPAPPKEDAGWALVRIFGRMAELVVNRLNRLPDRNFLAFLDLIGTRREPPQPARVPLTFLLAAGSPVDALVPAGTQAVAAALEGEAEPPLFATERDLVVTRSQLVAVCTRDPVRDGWDDYTEIATGRTAGTFQPFRGGRQIAHRLYVDHSLLGRPEAKAVELRIGLAAASPEWPSTDLVYVAWSFWNGTSWQALDSQTSGDRVKLTNLPRVAAARVNGREGHWLRGELKASDGKWPQPVIDSLSLHVTIHRTDIVPERGFTNQIPLDLSTDFLPFGEKPKLGDVFYLANDEAFSQPGAAVSLQVDLSHGTSAAANDLLLSWEFWDEAGRKWRQLTDVVDGTNQLTRSGAVKFTAPQFQPSEVNGELRHWLRVRIARGNYGAEAHYEQQGDDAYKLVPATLAPPFLRSVRAGYSFDSGEQNPECMLTENDFVFKDVTLPAVGKGDFPPFSRSAAPSPTLHLGFERPGDAIGFANRSTALFFQVSEALFDPEVEPETVTEEAAVVWEFWNGTGWELLGTGDETRGLTRHGLLTFIGPPDFKESVDFGRKAFWLRGRWARGEYAVEPRLVRILTNTMWATHAETIREEVLGSSRGERGQVFRTLRTPVLDGPLLEVIEPEVPSSADLAELEADEGDGAAAAVRDAAGQLVEVRVRWHEVPDFHGSGPRSRHYVLDPLSGEVRFGDGSRGLVPPPGRNNVRMAYRAGGGLAGNRPPGSITRLKGTVPYVTGVAQPLPAEGGAAAESLEAVRTRGPKALRHRHRAVAVADFEDLAFEASSEVARARALPARGGSGAGRVSLIIVPASGASKPVPGLELLARVRSYLEARLSPVVELHVTGPDWLQMDVKAEIVPRDLDAAVDVQNGVLDRLRAFLHPLSGGPAGDGWELGRKPHRSDLYALIEEAPGVDHVLWLHVTETPREGGARTGRFHVFSGTHQITVSGNVDDAAAGPRSRP